MPIEFPHLSSKTTDKLYIYRACDRTNMSDMPVEKHEIPKLPQLDRCIWIIYHIFTFTLSRYNKKISIKVFFCFFARRYFFQTLFSAVP